MTTPAYLTTQEVADRLGVSVFTIRRYIRAGKLRAVKLDGVYRLGREELAEFLKSREIGGADVLPAHNVMYEPSPPAHRLAEPSASLQPATHSVRRSDTD